MRNRYEETQQDSSELESAKMVADSAKEALKRAEDENQLLKERMKTLLHSQENSATNVEAEGRTWREKCQTLEEQARGMQKLRRDYQALQTKYDHAIHQEERLHDEVEHLRDVNMKDAEQHTLMMRRNDSQAKWTNEKVEDIVAYKNSIWTQAVGNL